MRTACGRQYGNTEGMVCIFLREEEMGRDLRLNNVVARRGWSGVLYILHDSLIQRSHLWPSIVVEEQF